jgi:tetratricopeptide (TPR) repeat protein
LKYLITLIVSLTCFLSNAQSSFSEKVDSVYAIAQYYYQLGAYKLAIESQQELVNLLENSEYADAYINQLSMLGSMYDANNDVPNAIITHSKVINLIVANYGEAEFLSTPYTNLILAYIKIGQYDSAKATYKRFDQMYSSLAYIENAETYLYLAANIREKLQMKYVYSEEELGIAKSEITVAKNYYGDDSPIYGKVAAYIGNLFVFLGDFDEGIPYLKKAVSAYEQNKIEYAEEYIKALNDLVSAYTSMENYADAQSLIEELLLVSENYYGENASENALGYYQLSRLHYGTGDYAQAEE